MFPVATVNLLWFGNQPQFNSTPNSTATQSEAGKLAGYDAGPVRAPLTDLLPGEGSEEDRYPKYFPLGDARLPLHYLPIGAVLLWALGQLAVYAPARRAASIPPATATRSV